MKPLEGIKVLDFTQYAAGPYATMLMGEFGAEVIKLENPALGGDPTRHTPEMRNNVNTNYAAKNHDKKTVLLNMKDPRQVELFLKMVETADVVMENFKPGTMEKFGITYEVLKARNPKIVYTSISGFGQTGPLKDLPAVDGVIQAMSGFMSLTGIDVPTQSGPPIADMAGAMIGCIGTLIALYGAKVTGEGRRVDVALMDSLMFTYDNILPRYLATGIVPPPTGNRHPTATPFQPFDFKHNERLYICCPSDVQWAKFVQVIGRPEWATDPRYAKSVDRTANRDELIDAIQSILINEDAGEFAAKLRAQKVVCGEIMNLKEVCEHPQVKARNMLMDVTYTNGETFTVGGCPIHMDGVEPRKEGTAYPMGYHTIEVMSQYADPELVHEIFDEMLEKTGNV